MEHHMEHNETLMLEEMEINIQRFMQIRDEIQNEIKKIGIHVATLEETNKRLVAHFDVFEKLSKKAEDKIYLTLKTAGHDLMKEATKLFSLLIENLLREQIIKLDQTVNTAEKTLFSAVEEKNSRPFYYALLGWTLLVTIGFGIGSVISYGQRTVFPQEFVEKVDLLSKKVDYFVLGKNKTPNQRGGKK